MAERGRPKAPLVLSEEERDTLSRWARRPNSPQALALRSKIVLACAEGKTNEVVAAELRCSKPTVGKWRSRFVQKRLKGLADEYRPGVPRSITDDHVEAVVVKTLTEKPKDATHWSTRGMAKATACPSRRSAASGRRSASSRGWRTPSSCRATRCSSTRSETSSVVSQPARASRCALRGREDSGPGPGPHPTGLPTPAGHTRTALARLCPSRHHRLVRGTRSDKWDGHPPAHRPPPGHRVQEVLEAIDKAVPVGLEIHVVLDNSSTIRPRPSTAGS